MPGSNPPEGNYKSSTANGTTKLAPWKSVPSGGIDKLTATITGTPADSVFYSRESAQMVMQSKADQPAQRQVMATGDGDQEEDQLYAWYRQITTVADTAKKDTVRTAKYYKAGAVNLVSYEPVAVDLVLVPVNGSIVPTAGYVKQILDSAYAPAFVTWNVTTLTSGLSVELGGTYPKQLNNTDADDNMNLTDEEKLVVKAMKKDVGYNKDKYYLFFFDSGKDLAQKGYMPFKSHFGFIFKNNQNVDELMRTIAHEPAHGAFRLRHTFSDKNKFVQGKGSTDNLMDYVSPAQALAAKRLLKYQWDEIHNPGGNLFGNMFQSEEDGAMKDAFDYAKFLKGIKQAYNKKQNFSLWASPSDVAKKLYETKFENISVDGYYFSTLNIKISNLSDNYNLIQVNTYSQVNILNGILLDNQVEIIVQPNDLNALKEYLFNIPNPNGIKAGKILFVNGHWQSGIRGDIIGAAKPLKPYWSSNFEIEAKKYFSETSTYNIYIDGSSAWGGDESGSQRYERGRKWAEDNFNVLISNMTSNGTFKIVTHSEGAAFGAGIASYLIQNGKIIKKIVFLSPDEGDEFICPNNLNALQLSYKSCQGFDYKVTKVVLPRHYPYDPIVGDYWIKNVTKYGIVNRDDLLRDYLHGETKGSQVFKELKDLESILTQQNFDGNGKIFYKQVNTPNNTLFYKYNGILLQKECN